MEKCKIITLSNQKGGVGKTTTTYTLALAKISEMNEDHIEWLSDMNFFSEMFILQTALTLMARLLIHGQRMAVLM